MYRRRPNMSQRKPNDSSPFGEGSNNSNSPNSSKVPKKLGRLPLRDGRPRAYWTDTNGNVHTVKPKRHDLLVGNAVQKQDSHGNWHVQWKPEYAEKLYGSKPKPPTQQGSSSPSSSTSSPFGGYHVSNNNPSVPRPKPNFGNPQNILNVSGPKPGDYMIPGPGSHQSVPDITQSEHIADIDGLQLYNNPTGGYFFVHHEGPLPQNTFHFGDLTGQDFYNVMVKPAQVEYRPDLFNQDNFDKMYSDLVNKVKDVIKTQYTNTNPYDYDSLMLQYNTFLNVLDSIKDRDPKLYNAFSSKLNYVADRLSEIANANKPYWTDNYKPVSLGGNYVIGDVAPQSQIAPLPDTTLNQVYHYDPENGYINPVYHINTVSGTAPTIAGEPNPNYNVPQSQPQSQNSGTESSSNSYSGYTSNSGYTNNSNRSYAPVTYRKYAEEIVKNPKKLGSLPKNVFSKFYQRHKSAIKKYIQNPTYANKLGLVNEIKFALKKGEW